MHCTDKILSSPPGRPFDTDPLPTHDSTSRALSAAKLELYTAIFSLSGECSFLCLALTTIKTKFLDSLAGN